ELTCGSCRSGTGSNSVAGRRCRPDETGGRFRSRTEEVLFHLGGEKAARRCVERIETVLVDQHGLVGEPVGPRLFGDILVDALAELARPWSEGEPFAFEAELHAVDGSHAGNSLSRDANSLRTGAGKPNSAISWSANQPRSGSSATCVGSPS